MAKRGERDPTTLKDLGDGLILRRATVADAEALSAFNGEIHRDAEDDEPSEAVAACTRDLIEGDHPTCGAGDFTIVEVQSTGQIVSSLNIIPQTWAYGGIEFGVGRSELVGTHPDYQRRGLVRAQYEVVHEWSIARGHKIQAISGIPWFYRQFGYEMCLSLAGSRSGYLPNVPQLKEGEKEPYRLRLAKRGDLPFIAEVYSRAEQRYRVTCVRDMTLWRYELDGRSEKNINRRVLNVIETKGGEPVGFLAHPSMLWRSAIVATAYELLPGVSWLAVTPSVVRYMKVTGDAYSTGDVKESLKAFVFNLGGVHPVYEAIRDNLPRVRKPYAWYIRIPDKPDFLQHVAPVIEHRLVDSIVAGHTGDLKLSFYRQGLKLSLEAGKLTGVERWSPPSAEEGDAMFPDLTFLQLLFGYRSLEALTYAYADCWTRGDEARVLLEVMFPEQPSNVWPVS